MLQNLGVQTFAMLLLSLLKMDIDRFINDILDPVAEIYREVNLDDIYNLLGEPAKSLRPAQNLQFESNQRKRALSFVLLDIGKRSKY